MDIAFQPLGILPRRVITIIPAEGWKAVYASPGSSPRTFRKRLACFALVDNGDGRVVEGYTASDIICPVEKARNFLGYEDPGEHGNFAELWQEWHEDEAERVANLKTHLEPVPSPFTFSEN